MQGIRAIVTLPLMAICIVVFSGCSRAGRFTGSSFDHDTGVPISHASAAQHAFRAALEAASIPDGGDGIISICVESGQTFSAMFMPIAQEYLLERGYRLDHNTGVPFFTVCIDSLGVMLYSESKGIVERKATVAATIERIDAEQLRTVYQGNGTYMDNFTSEMLSSLENTRSFITNNLHHNRIRDRAEPLLVAVTMTVLAWMLYSYRG